MKSQIHEHQRNFKTVSKNYKISLLIVSIVIVVIGSSFSNKEKMENIPTKAFSYQKDIAPILTTSCTPCHFPPDGRKLPLENYDHVKQNIDSIIVRVKLPKDARGFMPFKNKKPALNDSLIAVLVQWKEQNMPE